MRKCWQGKLKQIILKYARIIFVFSFISLVEFFFFNLKITLTTAIETRKLSFSYRELLKKKSTILITIYRFRSVPGVVVNGQREKIVGGGRNRQFWDVDLVRLATAPRGRRPFGARPHGRHQLLFPTRWASGPGPAVATSPMPLSR